MTEPPEAARRLVLELVRPRVEAGACGSCGATLQDCGLDLGAVEPDRIEVVATCRGCGARTELRLRPATEGGAASIG